MAAAQTKIMARFCLEEAAIKEALLGKEVKGVASLRVAKARSQTALTHACQKYAERSWREDASRADCTRLTDCGGKEAAWVSATPSRPEYELKSADWRDSFCNRAQAFPCLWPVCLRLSRSLRPAHRSDPARAAGSAEGQRGRQHAEKTSASAAETGRCTR